MAQSTFKKRIMTAEDIIELSNRYIHALAVRNDGRSTAVVTGSTDYLRSDYSRDIMQRSLWVGASGEYGQSLICDKDGHAPAWNGATNILAYLSRASGTTQLWRTRSDGTEKKQLTTFRPQVDNAFRNAQLIWTLDGRHIIFTASVSDAGNDTDKDSIQFANAVEVEGAAPIYRFTPPLMEVWIASADAGEPMLLAQFSRPCQFVGWYEGGSQLLLSCGPSLHLLNPHTGECRVLLEESHLFASLDNAGRLWLVKAEQGRLRIHGVPEDNTVHPYSLEYDDVLETPLAFLPDKKKLYLLRSQGVGRLLVESDVITGTQVVLTKPDDVCVPRHSGTFCMLSLSSNGPLWVPVSSARRPMEVHVVSAEGNLLPVSDLHRSVDDLFLPDVQTVTWESDGWQIDGLLVTPAGGVEDRHPMLVYLHGGPSIESEQSFECLTSASGCSAAYYLAAHGFAVLMPNYRGSRSYGREFMTQLGHYHAFDRPFADVMAGLKMLQEQGIADGERLGIYGESFGAELSVWILGQTPIFKGASAAYGRYDQRSFARYAAMPFVAQNSSCQEGVNIDELWRRADLWPQLSPIEHAHNVSTPVLLLETSAERRAGQEARPLFNTLRCLGVETYLVYYRHAFHGGGWNTGYKRDYLQRIVAWFRHTLLGEELPAWFTEAVRECN